MRFALFVAFALGLAGCGEGPDRPSRSGAVASGDGSAPGARPNAPTPRLPATEPLTAYGRAPVRVGMDEREALASLGLTPPSEDAETADCRIVRPDGPAGLYVMLEHGRVVRVSVEGESAVRTREGLGIGSTEGQVRAIYADQLVVAPHEYVIGGKYLTWWADEGVAGLRFETDAQGRVTAMHGGGPAVAYSEGCA
jgi:hypothetical protein